MWSPFFLFSVVCMGKTVAVCLSMCVCLSWLFVFFYLIAAVFIPVATRARRDHLPVFLTAATSTQDAYHNYLPFDLVPICSSLFLILSVVRFMARPNTGSQGTQLLCVKLSHRFLTDSPHMGPGLKRVLEREKNQ